MATILIIKIWDFIFSFGYFFFCFVIFELMEEDRVEPATKILFKASFSPDKDVKALTLGSTGVRKRWMFNVYAFGLYFDPDQAKEELTRWNTYDMDELVTNLSFYHAIIGSSFEKGLRMVLARTVKGSDLMVAFEESLRPRVQRFASQHSHGHNRTNKELDFIFFFYSICNFCEYFVFINCDF